MCKAFSCVVTIGNKVYWQAGIDSHDDIINEFKAYDKDLTDDKPAPYNTFARVEITPKNGNYLDLEQNWIYRIDEQAKPNFLDVSHEFMCRDAFDTWKKQVYTFNVNESKNPINPLIINPPKKITRRHLLLLQTWSMVRDSVGSTVWDSVRDSVGGSVWDSVWSSVWDSVGDSVRDSVGDSVRGSVWSSVWSTVGAYIGSLFAMAIKEWKYIDYSNPIYQRDIYPFQPCVDLWKMGLVASYDGQKWRLHGGQDAKILWAGTINDFEKSRRWKNE